MDFQPQTTMDFISDYDSHAEAMIDSFIIALNKFNVLMTHPVSHFMYAFVSLL